jgi:c-di-GMP-binding flagellar brake protein YcgR
VTEQAEVLDLPVGTALNIQPTVPDQAPRYAVRLIGALPGASLVVTAPTVDGKIQIVREGQRFNVRVLKGERVLGFVAEVLVVALKPYAHLHLEYPTEFEQIVVRNASRVSANLPVLVRNTATPNEEEFFRQGTVVDLSETGLRLQSEGPFGRAGERLHLRLSLAVGGHDEALSLIGEVRSVVRRGEEGGRDGVLTGLAFQSLNRFQQILLHAWVTRRLLDEALRVPGP